MWMENNIEFTPQTEQALTSELDLDSVLNLSAFHKNHERADKSGNNSFRSLTYG